MVDKKTKKLLLIVTPVICVIMLALSVYVRTVNDQDTTAQASTEVDQIVRVSEDSTIVGVPRVVSADPLTAVEGERFTYFMEIVDSDSPIDDVVVGVDQKPDWMNVDQDNFILSGIPEIGSSDTQEVSLFITDGQNQVEHKFYLLILPKDE